NANSISGVDHRNMLGHDPTHAKKYFADERCAMRPRTIYQVARFTAIALCCIFFLFPLLWMLVASLKTILQITNPSIIFQSPYTLDNFLRVFVAQDFLQFMLNSL